MGKKILFFLIILALLFAGYTKYLRMHTLEQGLQVRWALIESEYQLKSDVLYNLGKHISGNLDIPLPLFDSLKQVRNRVAMVKPDKDNFSGEGLEQFRQAYHELLRLQARLLETGKQNPAISENQVYRELLAELDGTELRIANERRRFNEQVNIYNKYINGFFNIAIAQLFGFREWPEFSPIPGE